MSDLTESMDRVASAYDWFDADNVTGWVKFINDNGPCRVRVYHGMNNQGQRQMFLMALPESGAEADVAAMMDQGSQHAGVMELSHVCPPICP